MKERGIALIAVLWITVLLTVIASGFAFSMRGGALAARNTMSAAQARAVADGAVERVVFELLRPRNSPDAWLPDGRTRTWNDGRDRDQRDRGGRGGSNRHQSSADPLLKGVLENVGGLDPDTSQRVLEAILDWRDADELRRPNGAEADDYRAADLKHVPTNMPFEAIGELQRVMGVTPGLMAKIAPSLTVYSRQRGINPATRRRESLLALPA
jgi:general secretion pathway protein K